MPLDPSIPLRTQAPAMQSPIRTLGALAQVRAYQQAAEDNRLQIEARRRALDDDHAAREALRASNGRPLDAINSLYASGRYDAAGALAKQYHEQRKAAADELKARLENDERLLKFSGQILQGVSDSSSAETAKRALRVMWGDRGDGVVGLLGEGYDPDRYKQILSMATDRTEHLRQQQNAIQNNQKAWELMLQVGRDEQTRQKNAIEATKYFRESASQMLSTARNQEEWDGYQRLLAMNAPPTIQAAPILAEFGNRWSAEAAQRARQLGMSQAERETERHYRVTEANQAEANTIRRQRLEREEATGGAGRGLTANRRSEIAEWKGRQYAELEKAAKDSALEPEYVANRKLEIENSAREMLGLPPLEQAEIAAAADPSKHADLLKVRQTYRSLTGRAAPRERMDELKAAIGKEKDGTKKLELELELLTLRDRYEQDPAKKEANAARIQAIRGRLGR